MTISPGALVIVKQTGAILYAVVGRADDDICWRLSAKRVDHRGRHDFSSRIAGEGDITVIRPAPAYQQGEMIGDYEVARDLGDRVELIVPAHRLRIKGGDHLRYEHGNTTTIGKADIVLELMQ